MGKWKSRTWTGRGHELGHGLEYLFFVMLICFCKFCIALALYCYFMLIRRSMLCYWILALMLMEVLAGEKESTAFMARGRRWRKLYPYNEVYGCRVYINHALFSLDVLKGCQYNQDSR